MLRDHACAGGETCALGDRRSIDAFIATHGIVADATDRVLWVSAGPHLSGRFVKVDLRTSFAPGGETVDRRAEPETRSAGSDAGRCGHEPCRRREACSGPRRSCWRPAPPWRADRSPTSSRASPRRARRSARSRGRSPRRGPSGSCPPTSARWARSCSCAPTACGGGSTLRTTSRSGSVRRGWRTAALTARAGCRRRARASRAALQDLHELLGGDLSRLGDRWSLTVLRDDASGAEIEALPLATDASATGARRGPAASLRARARPRAAHPGVACRGGARPHRDRFRRPGRQRSCRRIGDAPAGVSRTRLSSAP